METRKQILTELQEIAPFLANAEKPGSLYSVPGEFFNEFPEILMNRIRIESSSLGAIETSTSSQVEIAEISTLLAEIKNKNPYQAPTGYFENFKLVVPEIESTYPKLVAISGSLKTKKNSLPKRFIRYAAAACIVGLIGIVTFNISHRPTVDLLNNLTGVSDQDMANFLDAADIHWTPDNSSTSPETAAVNFSDNEIHELLGGVPDIELEEYSQALPEEKRSVN
jgi:hypothetical protein